MIQLVIKATLTEASKGTEQVAVANVEKLEVEVPEKKANLTADDPRIGQVAS